MCPTILCDVRRYLRYNVPRINCNSPDPSKNNVDRETGLVYPISEVAVAVNNVVSTKYSAISSRDSFCLLIKYLSS